MALAPRDEINEPEDPENFRATLVEHLDELRARVMRSLFAISVAWLAGWFLEPYVYEHLDRIVRDPSIWPHGEVSKQVFTNFSEPFFHLFRDDLAAVFGHKN